MINFCFFWEKKKKLHYFNDECKKINHSSKPGLAPKPGSVFNFKNPKNWDPHSDLCYQCTRTPTHVLSFFCFSFTFIFSHQKHRKGAKPISQKLFLPLWHTLTRTSMIFTFLLYVSFFFSGLKNQFF